MPAQESGCAAGRTAHDVSRLAGPGPGRLSMDRRALLLSTLVPMAGACSSPPPAPPVVEPFIAFDGTAPHTRPIGSAAPGAQRAFDQGLSFLWSFNHDEAISS